MSQEIVTSPILPEPAHPDLPPAIAANPLTAPLLEPADSVEDALALTERLATGHYENFSVVSLLLPRRLRQHFCNIYAFCRIADDLGDEAGSPTAASRLLAQLRQQTIAAYHPPVFESSAAAPADRNDDALAGRVGEPALFTALRQTIAEFDIPADPFLDLISAFEQDQHITRYETADQLIDYCRRSANPVGRLVLYLCGYRDEHRQRLSDQTCTALQIINFCQDVRRDLLELNRIYIPRESLKRAGTDLPAFEDAIRASQAPDSARAAVRIETDRAESMFAQGQALLPLLSPDVRGQVRLFTLGGQAIVHAIRRQNHDTLTARPVLSKRAKAGLIMRVLVPTAFARLFAPPTPSAPPTAPTQPPHHRPISSEPAGPREAMT